MVCAEAEETAHEGRMSSLKGYYQAAFYSLICTNEQLFGCSLVHSSVGVCICSLVLTPLGSFPLFKMHKQIAAQRDRPTAMRAREHVTSVAAILFVYEVFLTTKQSVHCRIKSAQF